MLEIPVYLFTGFLSSGKTTFIMDNLEDPGFANGDKILLIACEEGEVEYDKAVLEKNNIALEIVEEKETLTYEFFKGLHGKHRPKKVVIEYNGMWPVDFDDLVFPRRWQLVQTITTVAEPTFTMYLNNMRSLISSQLANTDMVIFNRCTSKTEKTVLRRNVKAVNKRAQIYFEAAEGETDGFENDEMPFDINAPVIEIEDDDFGLLYVDAMDNISRYVGKTVKYKAVVYKSPKMAKNQFVPGRFVMTCCADDIGFIGFDCTCTLPELDKYQTRDWIMITAEVQSEYRKEYEGDGPVLYAKAIEPAEKPEDDLVYFN